MKRLITILLVAASLTGWGQIDYYTGPANSQYTLYSGANIYRGQSFTSGGSYLVDSVKFALYKTGSPTGNIYADIWNITGTYGTDSKPTGSSLGTSNAISIATLGTSETTVWKTFVFSTPVAISAGYYFVSVMFNGGDVSNALKPRHDSSAPYTHSGNYAHSADGSTWVAASNADVLFYVYGHEPPVTSETKKVNGVARAGVKKINGVAAAEIKKINEKEY